MDKKAKRILFQTYCSGKGWREERSIAPKDFAYAKEISKIAETWQIEQIGFSEQEIAGAEQRIGVRLPENYRNYLKEYGQANINYAYNQLVKPEAIQTTYQLIWKDIKNNWEEEFQEAKSKGTCEKYENDPYFLLWQRPVEEWPAITENYVILWAENQGVWTAGYLFKDLQGKNPNPPIYISINDDFITYIKCADDIKAFLEEVFEQAEEEM